MFIFILFYANQNCWNRFRLIFKWTIATARLPRRVPHACFAWFATPRIYQNPRLEIKHRYHKWWSPKKKKKINISRGRMLTILSNRIWNGKVYLDLRNSHHGSGAHMTQVQEPERQKFILSWHTCLLLLEFLKIKSNSHRRTLLPFILFLLCHECTGADVRNFEVKINLVFQIWFHWIVSIDLESGSLDTVTKENPSCYPWTHGDLHLVPWTHALL